MSIKQCVFIKYDKLPQTHFDALLTRNIYQKLVQYQDRYTKIVHFVSLKLVLYIDLLVYEPLSVPRNQHNNINEGQMIYEIRVYEHEEGCAQAVRERFEAEVAPRFPNHDIELVGLFVDAKTQNLTYMTRYPNEEARKKAWESFKSDPDWLIVKAKSEENGPLIAKQHVTLLTSLTSDLPIS